MATYISGAYSMYGADFYPTSDAAWRIQLQAFHNAFAGVGLVQTSDTGQINPATSVFAVANMGYEMWRFTDAAQATDPVFFRVDYIVTGSYRASPILQFTVGTGSNGTGTVTGFLGTVFSAVQSSDQPTSAGAGTGVCYAYFNNGNFWIIDGVMSTSTSNSQGPRNYFNIARSRDPITGALDGRGLFIGSSGGLANSASRAKNSMQFVRRMAGNTKLYPSSNYYCMMPGTHTTLTNGLGEIISYPHFYFDNGVRQAWATWSTQRSGLPSSPTLFTASPYGTLRTWLSWQRTPASSFNTHVRSAQDFDRACALILLWE